MATQTVNHPSVAPMRFYMVSQLGYFTDRNRCWSKEQMYADIRESIVYIGENQHHIGLVTTKIGYRKHIPFLDCDSENEMLIASHHIASKNYKYIILTSTPGHYWIIVNAVLPFNKVLPIITTCGNDRDYLHNIPKIFPKLFVRCTPKLAGSPVFPDRTTYEDFDPRVVKWIDEFRKIHESKESKQIYKILILSEALHNPSRLQQLMSDPEFTF